MNNSKIDLSSSKAWATFITIGLLIVSFVIFWVISSYHDVVFNYDSDRGSITLQRPNSSDQPISVNSGEPVQLREGDYILKRSGDNIIESEQTVTVLSLIHI